MKPSTWRTAGSGLWHALAILFEAGKGCGTVLSRAAAPATVRPAPLFSSEGWVGSVSSA